MINYDVEDIGWILDTIKEIRDTIDINPSYVSLGDIDCSLKEISERLRKIKKGE